MINCMVIFYVHTYRKAIVIWVVKSYSFHNAGFLNREDTRTDNNIIGIKKQYRG